MGGSDLVKQKEQLGDSPALFDYAFAENGLMAFKDGQKIGETSLVQHLGEEKLKKLINWVLRYFSDLDIPVKRGTFIEFRQGMLNLSPIGRNCSREERNEFEKFDLANGIRKTMVQKMKEEFADLNLTFSIGGQISFDVFPTGWDKTYCLRYLPEAEFDEIHFFGDKTSEGGNDFEIYTHPRTKGHSIEDANPLTTLKKLEELFGVPAPKSLTPPSSHWGFGTKRPKIHGLYGMWSNMTWLLPKDSEKRGLTQNCSDDWDGGECWMQLHSNSAGLQINLWGSSLQTFQQANVQEVGFSPSMPYTYTGYRP